MFGDDGESLFEDEDKVRNREWKAGFERRIIAYLARNSSPVDANDTMYGWIARDWQVLNRHLDTCGPDFAKCTWDDSEWSDFMGSMAEPQWADRYGIDVFVTCRCGLIAGRAFRCRESRADLIRAITDMDDPDPDYTAPPEAKQKRTPRIRNGR